MKSGTVRLCAATVRHESGWGMSVVRAARLDTMRGETRPALSLTSLACTAPRTAYSRFHPAASGRIAGSAGARGTYDGELAASEPAGTRVLMLPDVVDSSRAVTR
ncbi:hypothetical protein NicSoilB4_36060 [Arthrobacter sp. NicSoilB4]|nr:hypothetical protein NicSoilB4_36060 [Arthrobacter sp. NicSoilB4]